MGWNEYLIKCFAYQRMEKENWRKLRFLTFHSMIGSHLDPKKLPATEHAFLPLDDERTTASEARQRATDKLKEQRKHKIK